MEVHHGNASFGRVGELELARRVEDHDLAGQAPTLRINGHVANCILTKEKRRLGEGRRGTRRKNGGAGGDHIPSCANEEEAARKEREKECMCLCVRVQGKGVCVCGVDVRGSDR